MTEPSKEKLDLVEYKNEKDRLDFSIIDQDGKMRNSAAVLQSARVCQTEV